MLQTEIYKVILVYKFGQIEKMTIFEKETSELDEGLGNKRKSSHFNVCCLNWRCC